MSRIIDISQSLTGSTKGFAIQSSKKFEKDGWNASNLSIYSHAGTHMDAPRHFEVNDRGIDLYPADRFVCNCHIVRLPSTKPAELLGPEVLQSILPAIRKGEGVIFHTGWSKYINDLSVYRNHLPRISRELAYLLAEKQVNMVGVEPPSVADVNNRAEIQEIHRILLEADIIILEGLCNLDEVKKDYVQLISLPLKIENGDGAPARAIIIEN